jgi:hypothetical protein
MSYMTKISTGGWVLFVGLLILCFPLCWIGLLIKSSWKECPHCATPQGYAV